MPSTPMLSTLSLHDALPIYWRGIFYPAKLPTSAWFRHYSRHFATVELNAPFYSWPTVNTVKGWLTALSKPDFVYTVKVCEMITDRKSTRLNSSHLGISYAVYPHALHPFPPRRSSDLLARHFLSSETPHQRLVPAL